MRVIAGSARRIQLKTPAGMDTRPTTDRIKETLFNILQSELYGCKFLDIFGGSGAIGIEALSRGADVAWFIENNKEAVSCIKENLERTHFSDKATILNSDYQSALRSLEGRGEVFDIIFMDPPYQNGYEKRVLEYLIGSELLDKDSLIIFEAALDTEIGYIESMGYTVERIKEYKTNKHVFLRKT